MSAETTSPTPSTAIAVNLTDFPGLKRLATTYSTGFEQLAPYYAGDPSDDSAWSAAITSAQRSDGESRQIARVVQAQLRTRDAPASAVQAADRLADPKTVAIVTGQQAGLFGGPLYTLLKAITAIRLATDIEQRFEVPTVAVFWVDAEDHDLDEIRSCNVLDSDQQLVPVTLDLDAPPGTPACAVSLGPEINTALDRLAAALPVTDFTNDVLAALRNSYAEGTGLVTGFASWLERLLGPRGLVVFDSSDRHAKPLVTDLFVRELSNLGVTSSLARSAGAQLQAAGFHAQVEPPPDGVALFLQDGSRQSIRHDGGQLRIGDRRLDPSALVTRVERDAACLSPNVLLRPLVQDRLFPTICCVPGPNELAYLGQLKQVYHHFNLSMPLMAPRLSATIVDTAVVKFLRRTNIALDALQPQDEAALNRLLGSQLPPDVERTLNTAQTTTDEAITAVIAAVGAVDPTLSGAAESTRGRMSRDLANLQNKVVQAAKRKDQTLRRQFSRAQSQMFPRGSAQERVVAGVSLLNRYGPALIDRLLNDSALDTTHHWVLAV